MQRFVNDEPIKARRVGPLERLGRWCRRNPTVASLTAAVLVLMAVGTAVSTWQAVVATRAQIARTFRPRTCSPWPTARRGCWPAPRSNAAIRKRPQR